MTVKTPDTPKRRDKLVIMAEIMDIAKRGALKTQIMYRANLSFSQLTDYLALLTTTNLLAKAAEEGRQIYKATDKGIDFLLRHEEMMGMLREEQPLGRDIRISSENLTHRRS